MKLDRNEGSEIDNERRMHKTYSVKVAYFCHRQQRSLREVFFANVFRCVCVLVRVCVIV